MTDWTHATLLLDALGVMLRAALPALDAEGGIIDGPPTTALPDDYIIYGYNPGTVARPQVAAVRGRSELSDYIPGGIAEQFEVFCQISTYGGDTNISVLRSRTMGYFNAVSAALAADRSLGGSVPLPGKAIINNMDWYLEDAEDVPGCQVTVVFTIFCRIEFM